MWKVSLGNYIVVVHEETTGGFWGEVPALPGCYSRKARPWTN
jgi:predicted RNase H-like HicB family nuclease